MKPYMEPFDQHPIRAELTLSFKLARTRQSVRTARNRKWLRGSTREHGGAGGEHGGTGGEHEGADGQNVRALAGEQSGEA